MFTPELPFVFYLACIFLPRLFSDHTAGPVVQSTARSPGQCNYPCMHFQGMFIITALHRSHFMRTSWFQSSKAWYKCLSMGTTAGWILFLINKLTFRRGIVFHSTSTFYPLLKHKESSNRSFKKDLKPHWISLRSKPLLLARPNLKGKK